MDIVKAAYEKPYGTGPGYNPPSDMEQHRRFWTASNGKRNELMFMLRESGLTYSAIGKLAGVSPPRVRQKYLVRRRHIRAHLVNFAVDVQGRAKIDASEPGDIRDEWVGG